MSAYHKGVSWMVFLCLTSCSLWSKKEDARREPDPELVKKYDEAMTTLEQENYALAAMQFDHILVSKPASELELVISFNAGAAYEGLGDCKTANQRYRQVTTAQPGKYPRIESQAFYRLGFTYECLGQDAKAIASLLDALKRKADLPLEVASAEIPARLAIAYARSGNRALANKYYLEANSGLKTLRGQIQNDTRYREMIARTLFLMGQLTAREKALSVMPESYLASLSYLQPYLLQSVEMDVPNWSAKSSEQLLLAYRNIWPLIEKIEPTKMDSADLDKHQARRDTYERRGKILQGALRNIKELQTAKFPKESKTVAALMGELNKEQTKFQSAYARYSESNFLTDESERREGLKREGKILGTNKAPPELPKKKAKP